MEKCFIIGLAVLFIMSVTYSLYKIEKLKKENASSIKHLVDQINDSNRVNVKLKNAYLLLKKGVQGVDGKGDVHKFMYRIGDRVVSVSHGFRHKSFTKEQLEKFFTTQTRNDIYEAFDW